MSLIGRPLGLMAATLALALAVVNVMLVGSASPERDPIVRRGRGTSHRLDALDSVPHGHESSEPDTTMAGLVPGGRQVSPAPDRLDTPPAAGILANAVSFGPLLMRTAVPCLVDTASHADAGVPIAAGRAPPSA